MPVLSNIYRRKRRLGKSIFLLLLLFASFSVTRQAWAQATTNFDLGCRSVLSVAGGLQTLPSGNAASLVAFGQWAQGDSQSANYQVRSGYIQPRAFTASGMAAIAPAHVSDASIRFLPFIQKVSRSIRGCQY